MTTMTIASVTLTLTDRTAAILLQEIAEDAADRAYWARQQEIEKELWEYLLTLSPSDPEYSDIYKEVHGCRPR